MYTRWSTPITFAAIITAALSSGASAARQDRNCYEDIGCPWKELATLAQYRKLSCQNLAHVRNHTYYENYYCFHSAATKSAYGNKNCKYSLTALVPLNSFEATNVSRIKQVEKEKRCK